jgi:hypothetical protein
VGFGALSCALKIETAPIARGRKNSIYQSGYYFFFFGAAFFLAGAFFFVAFFIE